jgi:hypothetical protein
MDSLSYSLPDPHRYGRTVVWQFASVTDAFLKVFAYVSPFFHRVSTYATSVYGIGGPKYHFFFTKTFFSFLLPDKFSPPRL